MLKKKKKNAGQKIVKKIKVSLSILYTQLKFNSFAYNLTNKKIKFRLSEIFK